MKYEFPFEGAILQSIDIHGGRVGMLMMAFDRNGHQGRKKRGSRFSAPAFGRRDGFSAAIPVSTALESDKIDPRPGLASSPPNRLRIFIPFDRFSLRPNPTGTEKASPNQ